jgi:anti-anti-sigma factor
VYQDANLDIDIREHDHALVVVVEGEVDLCAAEEFERVLATEPVSTARAIVLDLDRVSFMDSAGARVLVQFVMAEGNRDRLALTPGSRQVQRLFDVTGVRRHLSFVPSA